MSLGQPASRFELRTCPKCGAVQESSGSTVCEQCGTDLRVASMQYPSLHSTSAKVKIHFRMPSNLLRRSVTALVVLAVLVVGLSFVPAVSARVPAMKKIASTTRTELLRVERFLAGWIPWLKPAAQVPRRASTPRPAQTAAPAKKPVSTTTQQPAPIRTAAVQAVTVKSNPVGVTVQLNAKAVGKTPMTLKLAPGTYKVTFSRPGYISVTRTITVRAGQAASVNVTLAKASSAPGPAPVTTAPQPTPGGEGK